MGIRLIVRTERLHTQPINLHRRGQDKTDEVKTFQYCHARFTYFKDDMVH